MPVLIDAIDVKRRTRFEIDNTPFSCLEVEVNTPTARGGQTLVRLRIRNLITNAVFEKTFKAGEKFREPDLQTVPASYLYSDSDGSYFLDQESYETHTLSDEVIGNALDFLIAGTLVELLKYNGNPIGLGLPMFVELAVASTEPGVRGDSSSGSVTKPATLDVVLNSIKQDGRTKKDLAGFSAQGTLKRSDFGMKYLVGAISDDVTLMVEILGDAK